MSLSSLFQSLQANEDYVGDGLRIAGLIVGATACFLFVVNYPILTAIIALSMIAAVLVYYAEDCAKALLHVASLTFNR